MAYNPFENFVKNGRAIFGLAFNYKPITNPPPHPVVFTKNVTSYLTQKENRNIELPEGFVVNEEVELGVIIGKVAKNVNKECADSYVAGYCLALDLTATKPLGELRSKGFPWFIGKSFDTSCPVSNFISREQICDPHNVDLWCKINGKLVQKCNTKDLLYNIGDIIEYLSKYVTLYPNDLILTGTCDCASPIKCNDVIECGLGPDIAKLKFNIQ